MVGREMTKGGYIGLMASELAVGGLAIEALIRKEMSVLDIYIFSKINSADPWLQLPLNMGAIVAFTFVSAVAGMYVGNRIEEYVQKLRDYVHVSSKPIKEISRRKQF